jgi:hypothetical protein
LRQHLQLVFKLLSAGVSLLSIINFFELSSFFYDAFKAVFQISKAFIFGPDFKLIADSAYIWSMLE